MRGETKTETRCPVCGQVLNENECVLAVENEKYTAAEIVHRPRTIFGDCGYVISRVEFVEIPNDGSRLSLDILSEHACEQQGGG